jgi:hypothetical protein
MGTIIQAVITLILIAAGLASCNRSATVSDSAKPDATQIATSISKATPTIAVLETSPVVTYIPASLPTLSFGSPTTYPVPYTTVTPGPDQQVYLDPVGWYSVNFPADMEPGENPGYFSRQDAFFETGYLPEFGYMSSAAQVCSWLANIEARPEESSIDWYSYNMPQGFPSCSLSTRDTWPTVKYAIYENSAADPDHRFIYIKTGESLPSVNPVLTAFSWLKPIDGAKFESHLAPLSPEETSLWKDVSVTEYVLPAEAQVGPTEEMLLGFVPEEMRPDWSVDSTTSKEPTIEEQLKTIGYELKADETKIGWKQLFRAGRLLFDSVASVRAIYSFSTESGPITAFVVNTAGMNGEYQTSFLIQNDIVHTWEYNHQDPHPAPILYQGEVLWLKATKDFSHIQVIKSNREVVYSFAVYTEPMYAVDRFNTWNGHWILAARDFVIQDGEILNETLGFQEIFSWTLIDDKPAYFFRKGTRVGFSYDGKILPLEYQEVAHHLCCGFASNNPYIGQNAAHVFARRNGLWYYVTVKFK